MLVQRRLRTSGMHGEAKGVMGSMYRAVHHNGT